MITVDAASSSTGLTIVTGAATKLTVSYRYSPSSFSPVYAPPPCQSFCKNTRRSSTLRRARSALRWISLHRRNVNIKEQGQARSPPFRLRQHPYVDHHPVRRAYHAPCSGNGVVVHRAMRIPTLSLQESTGEDTPMAQHMQEPLSDTASHVAQQVSEQVDHAVETAKDQATSRLEEGREQVAERLYKTAHALRQVGQQLREQEEGGIASLADRAAQQAEQASGYLRSRDLPTLLEDTEQVGRTHPLLFMGGAIGIGLLGVRFLKASRHQQEVASPTTAPPTGGAASLPGAVVETVPPLPLTDEFADPEDAFIDRDEFSAAYEDVGMEGQPTSRAPKSAVARERR